MASAVATPLEKQFSTIAGLDAMTSTSAPRRDRSITLQFALDRNIDAAAQDVQAAIAKTLAPAAAGHHPAVVPEGESGRPADPVLRAHVDAAAAARQLDEYAETFIAQRISTVHGRGAGERVRLAEVRGAHPARSAGAGEPRQIGIDEVADAIDSAEREPADGRAVGPDQPYTVQANGQLDNAGDVPARSSSRTATARRSAWATSAR